MAKFGINSPKLLNSNLLLFKNSRTKQISAYPNSGFGEIHQRIGLEINIYKVRRMLKEMLEKGILIKEGEKRGEKRGAKYFIKQTM